MSGKGVREPKRAYACITLLFSGVRRRRGIHQESEGITGNGRYVYHFLQKQSSGHQQQNPFPFPQQHSRIRIQIQFPHPFPESPQPHPHPLPMPKPFPFPQQQHSRIRIQIQLPHPLLAVAQPQLLLEELPHPQPLAVKSLISVASKVGFYGLYYAPGVSVFPEKENLKCFFSGTGRQFLHRFGFLS